MSRVILPHEDPEVAGLLGDLRAERQSDWLRQMLALDGPLAINFGSVLGVRWYAAPTPTTNGPTVLLANGTIVLSEMTTTFTTTGGPCLCLFNGSFVTNQSPTVAVTIGAYLDTVLIGDTRAAVPASVTQTASAGGWNGSIVEWSQPAAGSHTFDIRWSTTAGTATCGALKRRFVVIEFSQ